MTVSIRKFLIVFLVGLSFLSHAQKDKKEILQQKRTRLKDEIELANKILKETRSKESVTLSQVQTLARKIRIREELIRTINREVALIDEEIKEAEGRIRELEGEIEKLKADYAEMIKQAARTQSRKNKIMFILASQDFSQALRRMEYLEQIAEFRKDQVEEIKRKQDQLNQKIAELEDNKKEKEALRLDKEGERSNLLAERQQQEQVIGSLKSKENQLVAEIRKKQEEADRLEKEIQRLIALELRRAREKAEREQLERDAKKIGLIAGKDFSARTSNKALEDLIRKKRKEMNLKEEAPSESFALTPEARALAASFVSNKGKLPWPVERGLVVGKFGPQPHPISKNVVINNPYIEIATEKDAEARACFEGEVTSVIRIPGANKGVLVRHGNYFTVYSNLIEVYVKAGDKISLKQPIGKVFTDEEDGRSVLQFGVWKDTDPQDPEPWLFGR